MRLINIFYFVVIRQVPAPRPPPRSVVIERFPRLPDKPRKNYFQLFCSFLITDRCFLAI
jgi:hypothetical protein